MPSDLYLFSGCSTQSDKKSSGSGKIPEKAKLQITPVSKILNVGWISEGTEREATVICPRGTCCFPNTSIDDEKPKLKKELDKIRMSAK